MNGRQEMMSDGECGTAGTAVSKGNGADGMPAIAFATAGPRRPYLEPAVSAGLPEMETTRPADAKAMADKPPGPRRTMRL